MLSYINTAVICIQFLLPLSVPSFWRNLVKCSMSVIQIEQTQSVLSYGAFHARQLEKQQTINKQQQQQQ